MKETAFEKFVKDFKNGPYTRVDLLFPNDNDVYFSFESKPPKKAGTCQMETVKRKTCE